MSSETGEVGCVAGAPLVIITGLSGAGKSTAMRAFEDLGCYCVDNLPPGLIPTFFNLYEHSDSAATGVVIASDVRSGALFDDFAETVASLEQSEVDFKVVYLDCKTQVLLNRFNEVRRSHPLQTGRSLREAIDEERLRLEPIREIATQIIDTSELDARGLREQLVRDVAGLDTARVIRLQFVSFGFKYGVPRDADFVLDVRFLPNPFYEPDLQHQTGEDQAVFDFVMGSDPAADFFDRVAQVIELTLDSFVKVGKLTLTVAVGCTGGRHRSVAFARGLAARFSDQGWKARALHRDVAMPEA
jgi:UPF0042 nucleotide-binding protein